MHSDNKFNRSKVSARHSFYYENYYQKKKLNVEARSFFLGRRFVFETKSASEQLLTCFIMICVHNKHYTVVEFFPCKTIREKEFYL